MNALLFERPVWFATGPLSLEEEAQEMEDFTYHRPVLAAEAVELLAPRPGALVVDATCGGGGHTEAILQDRRRCARARPGSGRDRTRARTTGPRRRRASLCVRRTFATPAKCSTNSASRRLAGALLDLGVSSRQLENAERGFSIMRNGPLDMRMDPRAWLTAADIVNTYSEEELTRLFRDLGEEPAARRIASLIVKMRKTAPFRETHAAGAGHRESRRSPRTPASGDAGFSGVAHGSERRTRRTARTDCAF